MGHGLALDDDALDEESSAVEREPGVTVSHEDLRFVKTAISTMPGGLLTSAHRHQRHGRVQLGARDIGGPNSSGSAEGGPSSVARAQAVRAHRDPLSHVGVTTTLPSARPCPT